MEFTKEIKLLLKASYLLGPLSLLASATITYLDFAGALPSELMARPDTNLIIATPTYVNLLLLGLMPVFRSRSLTLLQDKFEFSVDTQKQYSRGLSVGIGFCVFLALAISCLAIAALTIHDYGLGRLGIFWSISAISHWAYVAVLSGHRTRILAIFNPQN